MGDAIRMSMKDHIEEINSTDVPLNQLDNAIELQIDPGIVKVTDAVIDSAQAEQVPKETLSAVLTSELGPAIAQNLVERNLQLGSHIAAATEASASAVEGPADPSSPEEAKVEEDVDPVLLPESNNLNFVAVEKLSESRFLLKHESNPAKNIQVEVHQIDDDIVEFRGMPLDL